VRSTSAEGRSRRGRPGWARRLFPLEPCGRWRGRLTAYIVREHQRGRPLAEILADPFVAAHATDVALTHLLEDPRLIHRLAADCRFAPGLEEAAARSD
jgi:hypothetical protein